FFDIRGGGGFADVGVDFALRGDADAHRLERTVMDVGWDDHPSAGNFGTDQFRGKVLTASYILHLSRDHTSAGIMHLSPDRIIHSLRDPLSTHVPDYATRVRDAACSLPRYADRSLCATVSAAAASCGAAVE